MFFTRIAPTPSGYIHTGNAVNFTLIYALAKHTAAKIELRIDDIDQNRAKKEYIDDVFDTLQKLGIEWDFGARDSDDFLQNYSFAKKQKRLFDKLTSIHEANPNLFYICKCARNKPCNGACAALGLKLEKNKTALKMRIEKGTVITLGGVSVDLGETFGDVTLWQKEGFASYQFASLLSDVEREINLIVRGLDLFHSSALQLYMAKIFGFENFLKTTFVHHALVFDEKGDKLSKSKGSLHAKLANEIFQKTAEMIGVREFWAIDDKSKLLSCKDEINAYLNQHGVKFEQCIGG